MKKKEVEVDEDEEGKRVRSRNSTKQAASSKKTHEDRKGQRRTKEK
jgi:hypothetical protein